MKRPVLTVLSLAICVGLIGCQRSATPAPAPTPSPPATVETPAPPAPVATKAPPVDLEQVAQRVVNQSAGVKEGEAVLITGRSSDAELIEDIAVEVRKIGGFPLVEYGSDRLAKRLFFDVPTQYDTQTDGLAMRLADVVNVVINVANQNTEDLMAGADPARLAARGKAGEAVGAAFIKAGVRTVELGNNLYPTPWRAQRYGLAEDALAKTFWDGVNVDYAQLQTRGEQVKTALAAGKELHITNPNGTDLKLQMGGRPVLVSDGIISAEDLKQGGGALAVYLPAGEVYTTPVAGTAEGKVVHSRSYFQGKEIDDLTLTFAAGKLTAMTGTGPGYAGFKAQYDAVTDPRKDEFGYVDLGINPEVKLPAESKVGTWVPAGSVTVGSGANIWAGGSNSVPYGTTVFLPGSTVTLDGKTIVDHGTLKL